MEVWVKINDKMYSGVFVGLYCDEKESVPLALVRINKGFGMMLQGFHPSEVDMGGD